MRSLASRLGDELYLMELDEALAAYRRAVALDDALAEAHYNLAVLQHLQQAWSERC